MSDNEIRADGMTVHGTTVALGAVAALLRGPSGSGKSDLALRFLAGGGQWPGAGLARALVADDQTMIARQGRGLDVSAPPTIAGLLEVRGLGIRAVPMIAAARLCVVVDLVDGADVDRMPEPAVAEVLGVSLPLWRLHAFEVSAPVKLAMLLADYADGERGLP